MSRIYEALQRADLERKAGMLADTRPLDVPQAGTDVDMPLPVSTGLDLDRTARYPWKPDVTSLLALKERGKDVEQLRRVRSYFYQARYEAPLKTVLVSSGLPSEGKSMIALNLAVTLARDNANPVLLIDGDLRRPTLHGLLGAPQAPGLAEYLAGNAGPQDVVQRDLGPHGMGASTTGSVFNLAFLPSGKIGDNASELVANHRIEGLIASLTPYFEWIIVDSPPVLAVTDAVDLARAADGVLLVAREAKTPLSAAQNSLSLFSNSRVLGFVLNAVKDSEHGGHKYYYYYGNDGKTKKGNSSD